MFFVIPLLWCSDKHRIPKPTTKTSWTISRFLSILTGASGHSKNENYSYRSVLSTVKILKQKFISHSMFQTAQLV